MCREIAGWVSLERLNPLRFFRPLIVLLLRIITILSHAILTMEYFLEFVFQVLLSPIAIIVLFAGFLLRYVLRGEMVTKHDAWSLWCWYLGAVALSLVSIMLFAFDIFGGATPLVARVIAVAGIVFVVIGLGSGASVIVGILLALWNALVLFLTLLSGIHF